MAKSKDINMDVRNIAEEIRFVALKLEVVGTDLGESPDPENPLLEGLECILNDQVDALKTLAEKLFELSGGTGKLFARKAA
jgi:hypothetical protein